MRTIQQKTRLGGVIHNDHLALISILAIEDEPGIAAAVLGALGARSLNVQFVVQMVDQLDQAQMVLCVDRDDLSEALGAIESVRDDLQPAAIRSDPNVASVAIFGPDFRERPGIAGQMFRALFSHNINILAISTSISTVACILDRTRLDEALQAISEYFELP